MLEDLCDHLSRKAWAVCRCDGGFFTGRCLVPDEVLLRCSLFVLDPSLSINFQYNISGGKVKLIIIRHLK